MSKYSDNDIAKGICDGVSKLPPDMLHEILCTHFADDDFIKAYFDQILKFACTKFDKHTKNKFPKNHSILERMKDYGWLRIRMRFQSSKIIYIFMLLCQPLLKTGRPMERIQIQENWIFP